jgi:hypothetical protein
MHDEEILGTITNTFLTQWKWLIGFNLLQNYELLTPHDESIWLSNIRNFMIEHNIKITKTIQAYPLLRENDEYLMEKLLQLTKDAKEIRHINYCRLYLNIITISDITEPDGKYICSDVYQYNKATAWRQKNQIKCYQQIPERLQWYAWHKLLNSLTFIRRR